MSTANTISTEVGANETYFRIREETKAHLKKNSGAESIFRNWNKKNRKLFKNKTLKSIKPRTGENGICNTLSHNTNVTIMTEENNRLPKPVSDTRFKSGGPTHAFSSIHPFPSYTTSNPNRNNRHQMEDGRILEIGRIGNISAWHT